jgi:hypothetical protein
VGLGVALSLWLGAARTTEAAPEWIFRSLTLPRGDVALDLGLGLGHRPVDANTSVTGYGMSLGIDVGVASDLELGLHTGIRFGAEGRATRADRYGRPWQTEGAGRPSPTGADTLANPEILMRWSVARGRVAQLALEGRAFLPIEGGTRFGIMLAAPLRLRLGAVGIDTGVYVPIIFEDPTASAISFPFQIWIQATRAVWLGPLLGIRIVNQRGTTFTEYPFGFGLGVAMNPFVDLRTWILFPDISGDAAARTFGAGVALQIRFE